MNDANYVAVACNMKIQPSAWKKGKQRQTKLVHQKNNTGQNTRQSDKQQTITSYGIKYKQTQKQATRPEIQTIEDYEQVTVQNGNSNHTTERTMTRTKWLLFAKWQYKHEINKMGK